MRIFTLAFTLLFFCSYASAQIITGHVRDAAGKPVTFASITVKETNKGAAANSDGRYGLNLSPGTYTLLCEHVGYTPVSKKITVSADMTLDFVLEVRSTVMSEVVIKRGADPALAIMKEVIKKRPYYNKLVDSFQVDLYVKGMMRLLDMPDKFMGSKVDKSEMMQMGLDSNGRGMLFVTESESMVSWVRPNNIKMQVKSSRMSGGNQGIDFPQFVNFYNNNVKLFSDQLNSRGFVSPISDNAFHYYNYKYEGDFFDGDKMIDVISVKPKRKFEPLFSGTLMIVDGDWMIHSLDLLTTSQYQLELLDSMQITQFNKPVEKDIWKTSHQVMQFKAGLMGVKFGGAFLNVYNDYNLHPELNKKFFDRTLMVYDTAFNKRDSAYWSLARPVPLEDDEKRTFRIQDSLSKQWKDSVSGLKFNIDTFRKHREFPRPSAYLFKGGEYPMMWGPHRLVTYTVKPMIFSSGFNTVEGLQLEADQSLTFNTKNRRFELGFDPRYGFSNQHFNLPVSLSMRSGRITERWLYRLEGGKRVSQFNHDNPVNSLVNTVWTLFRNENLLKIYENWFVAGHYEKRWETGFMLRLDGTWEDRIPLNNTTTYSFTKRTGNYTPNHPIELANIPFERHQAFVTGFSLSYQPGQRYIQMPTYRYSIGSSAPIFSVKYDKGIPGVFNSVADFDKWYAEMRHNLNFKLKGVFSYRIGAGGFLTKNRVDIPDFRHFTGNNTVFGVGELNSFSLAPYYRYSNTERLYGVLYAAHHFNGFLTNKIPLFNRLKWNLVAGTNSFYVNRDNYYSEVLVGIENILKVFRVDFVWAYQAQPGNNFGIRVGKGGLFGSAVEKAKNLEY